MTRRQPLYSGAILDSGPTTRMKVGVTTATLCATAMAACIAASSAQASDAIAQPRSNDWTEVAPPGSHCANGAPWRFWYRAGAADKLAVWFEGADACWNAALCDRLARTAAGAPAAAKPSYDGIFDDARADNPLRDFTLAVLPSCTGDAHVGQRTADYRRTDGTQFTFAHDGARNARAALDHLQQSLQAPQTIFVGGDGTGAIGAAYWASEIGDRYGAAQLIVLGDSAGGYRSLGANKALRAWGALDALPKLPAYADPDRVFFESFYVATAQRHPSARLAQVNFADDAVQRRFMSLLGTPVARLTKPLTCNLNEVRIDAPGFHSFIYPGTRHTLLRTNALYSTRCHGQSLTGWIDDLIAGRPIENRWCDEPTTTAVVVKDDNGLPQPNRSPPL